MSTFQLSLPALRFFAALSCGAVTQRQVIARGVSASSVCEAAAELSLAGICRIVQIGSPALAGRAAISTLYGLSAPALPSAIAEHVAQCGLGLSRVILFLSERTPLSAKSLAADIAMSYAATRSAIDAGRARGLIHPERLELAECNAVERPKNQHNAPTISTACQETPLLNQAQHTSEQRPHAPDFAFDSVLKQKTVENQIAVVDSEIEKLLIARGVASTVAKSLAVNRAECAVQLQRIPADASPGKLVAAIRGGWRDALKRPAESRSAPYHAPLFRAPPPPLASESTRNACLRQLQSEFSDTRH